MQRQQMKEISIIIPSSSFANQIAEATKASTLSEDVKHWRSRTMVDYGENNSTILWIRYYLLY